MNTPTIEENEKQIYEEYIKSVNKYFSNLRKKQKYIKKNRDNNFKK